MEENTTNHFLNKVFASSGITQEELKIILTYNKQVTFEKNYYLSKVGHIQKFDGDFEIAPKKTYVSLKRKKQFTILNPASKTRFEIGFNLKGVEAKGKLENEKPNEICSHKINLADISEIDQEVIDWIKMAFDNAG
jgi:predicted transport protein